MPNVIANFITAKQISRITARPIKEETAYKITLHKNGKNRECLDFLKDVVFLPSELRENVSEVWRAAQKELGLEITYPENLGTGRPYPSDNAE